MVKEKNLSRAYCPFKTYVNNTNPLLGIWSALNSPELADIICHIGFDWVLIDCEHGPNSPETLMAQLNAYASTSKLTNCIVRISWNDPVQIKKTLDMGIETIMIPMISSFEEAQSAVAACHFPPRGTRGVAGISRASNYGLNNKYLETAGGNLCIILQIENKKGLDDLDRILTIQEVDGIFIGPSDLAASFGYLGNSHHKNVKELISGALKKILKSKKFAGTIMLKETDAKYWIKEGFQLMAIAHDSFFISSELKQLREKFKS